MARLEGALEGGPRTAPGLFCNNVPVTAGAVLGTRRHKQFPSIPTKIKQLQLLTCSGEHMSVLEQNFGQPKNLMSGSSRDTDHETHLTRRDLSRHWAADAEAGRLRAEASICHSENNNFFPNGPTVRPRGAVSTGTERSAALLSRKKIRAAAAYREVHFPL